MKVGAVAEDPFQEGRDQYIINRRQGLEWADIMLASFGGACPSDKHH
jgi:hypothetical protein